MSIRVNISFLAAAVLLEQLNDVAVHQRLVAVAHRLLHRSDAVSIGLVHIGTCTHIGKKLNEQYVN